MRNVIILGSGRSGTSMVAGTLSEAGYFMGDHLWPVRSANPKGFFEDKEVNEINEELLEPLIPQRYYIRGASKINLPVKALFKNRPLKWQRWLAEVPTKASVSCSSNIADRIENVTTREPYCFKDPRFCYTLSAWKPFLKNVVFICVFRDPASTAFSILKECSEVPYLADKNIGISINQKQALKIWTQMYTYVLENYANKGTWLFLHYNQALQPEGLKQIEALTDAKVDYTFPEAQIRRSFANTQIPRETEIVYKKLCALASYSEI